jgi:hypothetical protein
MGNGKCLAFLGIVILAATGCRPDLVPAASGTAANQQYASLFDSGFSASIDPNWTSSSGRLAADNWPITVRSGTQQSPGSTLVAATFVGDQQGAAIYGLDSGKIGQYTVFVWPKVGVASQLSVAQRKDEIKRNMVEYSNLVGTLLARSPRGLGEDVWLRYRRGFNLAPVWAAESTGDSRLWCRKIVNHLVNSFVPEGSEFIQYGNCGEGGHVGACLAKAYGFSDDEIRLCSSENDHFFAMHKDPDGNAWCILDRWALDPVGNYNCGVDIDTKKRVVTFNGAEVAQEWFQRTSCKTLKEFMVNSSFEDAKPAFLPSP